MLPEFVRKKRFPNMRDKIRRKIYRLMNMVMAKVPVTEAIAMLLMLVIQVLIFRPFIIKYIRNVFLR